MIIPSRFWLLLIALPLFLAGCQRETGPATAKQYEAKGKVVNVAPDQSAVTLDHEDIPGLMKAMQMKFPVSDPKVLDGIQAGDQVQGHLRAGVGGYVVTDLNKR